MRGIFAIDPGGSTGVAWGIFNERESTAGVAVLNRLHSGSATTTGSEEDQAIALFDLWQEFKRRCVHVGRLEPEWVDLVIEDFILRPGQHAGGKTGIMSARVGWAFQGYRLGRANKFERDKHISKAIWQPPSAVRHEQRLKKMDAWIRGREHERSAFCHVYERLLRLMK